MFFSHRRILSLPVSPGSLSFQSSRKGTPTYSPFPHLFIVARRHLFPSLTKEGAPAILETTGNPYAHLVLRGGSETGPNFDAASIENAVRLLRAAELPEVLMVDCSHGNSEKDATRQIDVADAIMGNLKVSPIRALMLESHLVAGRQNAPVTYGQSITDACLGFEETEVLLYRLADAV